MPGILDDPNASATPASRSLLLNTATGALVPHYTDVLETVEDGPRPVVLRPFAPLDPKTRYVVALQNVGLESDPTKPAAPAEGFRRLRDREASGIAGSADPLAPLARFETDVFDPLAKAGVARASLQLAWDFTTGSAEQPAEDMLAIRDATIAWLGANDPSPVITSSDPPSDRYATILHGTLTAPLFMDSPDPGAHVFRDAAGKVAQNGTATVPFEVAIAKVVADADAGAATPPAGRAIAFGHGFFGGFPELEGDGARAIADTLKGVLFAIEWWGMSKADLGVVSETLSTKPEHVTDFAERVHQAMANWIVTTSAVKTSFAKLPELAGKYDPSFVGYFGASQGHILGGTLAALDPDFSRIVLNVGGGAFTHIMPRSADFGPFALVAGTNFDDPLVIQSFFAMFQRPLDRIDPAAYAPLVLKSPLPGSAPDRRVLMQTGLGDAQVPNCAGFLHARALGVEQTMPAPQNVFGLTPVTGDPAGSAITLFDFGIDTRPYATPSPLSPNEVHGAVRVEPSALREMEAFMKPGGVIHHPCDGPCDPE